MPGPSSPNHCDVLIVGGGITGLSAAYELARARCAVIVLESRRLGAMGSGWTLGGVRQSGRHPAELPLARAAVARWTALEAELEAPTGYRRHGNLRLARDEAEVAVIRALVAEQSARGLDLRFLAGNAEVRALAPAIGPDILAASFCPGDGHADPDLTVAAFAAAARRHGADIREGVKVTGLARTGDRITGVVINGGRAGGETIHAGRVIVATGIHAPELLAPHGVHLPLRVRQVSVLRTVAAPPMFAQVFGVANADCAGRQQIDGRFRLTNGAGDWPGDAAGWTPASLQPPMGGLRDLITLTSRVLPGLAALGVESVWGGLIDLTPDALPMIDAGAGPEGLIVAAGFSGHGFGIGPVTGQILKALALGEATGFDLAPFRAGRFNEAGGSAGIAAPLSLHG